MKKHTHLVISALSVAIFALLAPASFAQKGQAMSKAQAMAQQLSLTPQQKEKILPILASEVPKLQHIKNDNSLSTVQKMEQVRAIHQQTDPQMKAILSPEQYQKLKQIRAQQSAKPHKAPWATNGWPSISRSILKIGSLIALSRNVQFLTRTIAQRTKCDRCKSALDSR